MTQLINAAVSDGSLKSKAALGKRWACVSTKRLFFTKTGRHLEKLISLFSTDVKRLDQVPVDDCGRLFAHIESKWGLNAGKGVDFSVCSNNIKCL